MEKKQVVVRVFEGNDSNGHNDWPPREALGFMEWFQSKLDIVPDEHKANAVIMIDCEDGYEGITHSEITIYYMREETNEEYLKRRYKEIQWEEEKELLEREQLAYLMEKYQQEGAKQHEND